MTKNINAVIIEDELNSLNNLKNLIEKYCKNISVIGDATTIEDGYKLISEKKDEIHVAFLDINLPDGLVFQLLNRLEEAEAISFEIIFVTSYQQFAIKACQYSSIGYVLKPIDPDELQEAVSRIRLDKDSQNSKRVGLFNDIMNSNKPNPFEKMSISALDGVYFINIKDILRCEAEDNYTHIYMKNGEKLTASKTIKYYEDMLSDVNFYRVHKSHLVNLNYMRKFVKGDGGYLIMDDAKKIEVSRRRRPAFMEKLKVMQEEI
jgi:two-component system, LytTR family, response regulator